MRSTPNRTPDRTPRTAFFNALRLISRTCVLVFIFDCYLGCGEHTSYASAPEERTREYLDSGEDTVESWNPTEGNGSSENDEGRSEQPSLDGMELHSSKNQSPSPEEVLLYSSLHHLHFPDPSLIDTDSASVEEISLLKSLLLGELRKMSDGTFKSIGVKSLLRFNISWGTANLADGALPDMDSKKDISLKFYVNDNIYNPITIHQGTDTTVDLYGPFLTLCRRHARDGGAVCNGLESRADTKIILCVNDSAQNLDLDQIKRNLTVSCVTSLSKRDLGIVKQRSEEKMKEHARITQLHIRDVIEHARLAEHADLVSHLSDLDTHIEMTRSLPLSEITESIVSSDKIPFHSAPQLGLFTQHLDIHVEAMIPPLGKAYFEAGRCHRQYLTLNATKRLKVEQ